MSAPEELSPAREQAQAFSRIALAAEAFVVSVAQLVALAVTEAERGRVLSDKWEAERIADRERNRLIRESAPVHWCGMIASRRIAR